MHDTLATTMTTDADTVVGIQTVSFWLAIFSMMVPTIEKVYELLVSQVSSFLRYRRDGGEISFKAIAFACIGLALVVPGMIAKRLQGCLPPWGQV